MTRDEELERWARRLVESADTSTKRTGNGVMVDGKTLELLHRALKPPGLQAPAAYRQSLIAAFDSCPLRARFSLEDNRRTPSPLAARGTLFHRFVHKAELEMWRSGEQTMPVEVGLEMAVEVLAQMDVPSDEVVPITMSEMRWVRVLITKWCETTQLNATRILDVEKRYSAPLELPTGKITTITGQMDLVLADPPDGVLVVDYKAGFRKPPQPRDPAKAEEEGSGLTALGWVQWNIYCFLIFANFPSVDRVIFRERHVLWGEERQARMERWQSEKMVDILAQQVALLDQAIEEGPMSDRWVPSAGTHCAMCSNPRGCPIMDDEKVDVSTTLGRRRVAQEWVVAGQTRDRRRELLDGLVDRYGPIEIPHADGRRVVGWAEVVDGVTYDKAGRKRTPKRFGIFEPQGIPESPYDEILYEAARERGLAG